VTNFSAPPDLGDTRKEQKKGPRCVTELEFELGFTLGLEFEYILPLSDYNCLSVDLYHQKYYHLIENEKRELDIFLRRIEQFCNA